MTDESRKTSMSIKISQEVKINRKQRLENYLSDRKSSGDFEFEELSSTSCSWDDEVFIDTEDPQLLKFFCPEPRRRRTSDVIDSMGESPPKEKGYRPPSSLDMDGYPKCSPPITPASDAGYYSTTSLPTPVSLLEFKPIWSRGSTSSLEGPTVRPKKKDHTDAKPNRTPNYAQAIYEGEMPVARDSHVYNMDHPRRGFVYIFNHDEFENDNMPMRTGSDIDVNILTSTYKLLGFEVRVMNNLRVHEIRDTLNMISQEDFSDCDCLTIVVLTHGEGGNFLYSFDYMYSVDVLWEAFTPDKCPTLAGKPKIFFVQACRGKKLDGGFALVKKTTERDSGASTSYKIPKRADFLIVFSTVSGYYSWRNPENGTWFIQTLCNVLQANHQTHDLMSMLTIVNRIVATEFESHDDQNVIFHGQKQVPSISSTLLREIFFKPKLISL